MPNGDPAERALRHAVARPAGSSTAAPRNAAISGVSGSSKTADGDAGLGEAAVDHDADRVAERQRLVLIVRDEHCGGAAALERVDHRAPGLLAQARVEGAERLVEQDDVGARRQRAGERHPLLLTARELVRVPAGERGSSAASSITSRTRAPRGPPRGRPNAMLAAAREVREQRAVLCDVPDAAPVRGHRGARRRERAVAEPDAPGIRVARIRR